MRRVYLRAMLGASLVIVGLTVACQQAAPPAAPDTRAADQQAVREAEAAWAKAAAAKDLEGTLSFYADDISTLPPNAAMTSGKDALRKSWSQLFASPGYAITWHVKRVEASGGDLAYSMGAYEETVNDAKGKPVADRGKFVTIWKRQADGTWRAIVDAFNSDLPKPDTAKK